MADWWLALQEPWLLAQQRAAAATRLQRTARWFLRKLVDSEPYYEHGLNLGLGFVNATAVARRAEAQRAPP